MTKQKQFTHTAADRTPYTYLIGWSWLDKWYYGVRYAKGCHPTDFWVTYFTSSYVVDEFRKTHGEPDVVDVRKIFDSSDKARLWENRVINRLNVLKSPKFLNRRGGSFRTTVNLHVDGFDQAKTSRATQKLVGDYAYINPILWSSKYCLIRECPTCNILFDARPKESQKFCSVNCCNAVINHNSTRKTYLCISPDGTEFLTNHLRDLCKTYDLKYGSMGHVANGAYKHHKGWQCKIAPDLITVPQYCSVIAKQYVPQVVFAKHDLIELYPPCKSKSVKSPVVIEHLEINSSVTSSFCAKPDFIVPQLPQATKTVNYFSKCFTALKVLIHRLTSAANRISGL